jgi:non-ribosomal peptide synthetase component F/methionyl-tRNA formyltransferase
MTTSPTFTATRESPYDQERQSHHLFSCVVIGETSLPVQCTEILFRAGHRIHAIISDDPEFLQWAQTHQIPAYHLRDDWSTYLAEQAFDYLFSIVNPRILPRKILSRSSQLAINYHDALLPQYAGLHASTWALLQQEVEHGITWHVMSEEIDAGDILKQRRIPLAPDETSLSLNLKCYEAAITAFRELVEELGQRQFRRISQDLSQRTYFSQHQRPAAGAIISWHSPAEEIARLCRALTFGPYLNPLNCPKLHLNGDFFIVTDYALSRSLTPVEAGTIRAIQPDGITVATTTEDFIVKSLVTVAGLPVSLDRLVKQYNLQVNQQLTDLAPEVRNELTQHEHEVAKHETFWRRRLVTTQPAQLPYFSQAETGPVDIAVLPASFILPTASHTAIQPAWKREHVLLTAFAVYLSRLNANPFDIGFTPLAQKEEAQRRTPFQENFFAPQVPFRVTLDLTASFAEAYAAIEREVALCTKHQTYTYDLLVRDPALHRRTANNNATSVAVVFLPYTSNQELSAQGGLTLYIKTDSTPQGASTTGNIEATFAYNPNALAQETLERLIGHLQTLLEAAVFDPAQSIATLPLLPAHERQQLLVTWNDTERDYPLETCVQQLFETQAALTPHAVAVRHDNQQLTYAELNARANQLAHYLQKYGVGPDSLVGLCVERSLAMVISILGILKAGGAYVPLDPSYPTARLTYILEDTQASVLVTQSQFLTATLSPAPQSKSFLLGAALSSNHHPIVLDTDSDTISQESVENLTLHVPSASLAYVIYTSGSTGQPKGVEIPHRALTNFVTSAGELYALQPTDRVLQFASISFDAAVEEIFPCLTRGSTLVLRTDSMLESLAVFVQRSREWQISVWDLPTAFWHELVQEMTHTNLKLPECVRLVIIGGEAALPERIAQWQHISGGDLRLRLPTASRNSPASLLMRSSEKFFFRSPVARHFVCRNRMSILPPTKFSPGCNGSTYQSSSWSRQSRCPALPTKQRHLLFLSYA